MRIGELSERTGTPIPKIKYYLREGLLPVGERTGRNQARYGDEHLRRLRLVRSLTEVGGLSIATVRKVLGEVDAPELTTHRRLGHTLNNISTVGERQAELEPEEEDRARVAAMVERLGWTSYPLSSAYRDLVQVIAAYRQAGHPVSDASLDRYALALEEVSRVGFAEFVRITERDELLEKAVIDTVLGSALVTVLRRLAHMHISAEYQGVPDPEQPGQPDD